MFSVSVARFSRSFILISTLLLVACGGGGGGGNPAATAEPALVQENEQLFIAGAGIKGPMAHANVELYALDATKERLFDPSYPLAIAQTDAFAQITALPVPANIPPPYILLIDGASAIDLNTGVTPVIERLVTIITSESLNSGRPVYATPYTTMAYHMLIQGLNTQEINTTAGISITGAAGAILQAGDANGLVSIEAENFDASVPAGGHRWEVSIDPGYSGAVALETTPNIGTLRRIGSFETNSPRLDYKVHFVKTGKHYVWIRGTGARDKDDSLHVGLDGTASATSTRVSNFKQFNGAGWSNTNMSGTVVTLNVPTVGEHTLNIWMREDGFVLDKVVLARDRTFVPAGNGPSPSLRPTVPTVAVAQLDNQLGVLSQLIIDTVGFGMSANANVFNTPPVITKDTVSLAKQQEAVDYRAAIEALSSMLYKVSIQFADYDITPDSLLEVLALDLYDDGVISSITTLGFFFGTLLQDPMQIQIANTQYQVKDILSLLAEEMALIGNSANVNLHEDVVVDLQTLSSSRNGAITIPPANEVPASQSVPVTAVASSIPANAVISVDFNNHPGGTYTEQDAINDFDADQSRGLGWSRHTKDTSVVDDPAGGATHGKVMKVTHFGGKSAGGPRFKVKFPAADDYYFAFDVFIPNVNQLMKVEKMPGLMYGSLLDASHDTGVKPVPEGTKAFSVMHTLLKPGTYAVKGNVNQFTSYIYDADRVQYYRWFNVADPVKAPNASTYNFPKGRWVRIEQRVRQNTATSQEGVGDRSDGILQQWVDGKLAVDRRDMHWRTRNTMHVDGIFFYNYYGGPADAGNRPDNTQHTYFDNFIVSTSPITH